MTRHVLVPYNAFLISVDKTTLFISNTRQFLDTSIYMHLGNLQRQEIEPLPLRVRFPIAARAASALTYAICFFNFNKLLAPLSGEYYFVNKNKFFSIN